MDYLGLELLERQGVECEVAGDVGDQCHNDEDPGGLVEPPLQVIPVSGCLFESALHPCEPFPVGSGYLWFGQVGGGRPIASGKAQRIVDQDGVRSVGAPGHRGTAIRKNP